MELVFRFSENEVQDNKTAILVLYCLSNGKFPVNFNFMSKSLCFNVKSFQMVLVDLNVKNSNQVFHFLIK